MEQYIFNVVIMFYILHKNTCWQGLHIYFPFEDYIAYPTSKASELLKLYFCPVSIYLHNAVNTSDYTVPNDWSENTELERCGWKWVS
jgi:hypothetical protein